MLSRVTAFVVWAVVAAVIVFWALRLFVRGAPAPSFTVPVSEATAVRGDLSRLFGKTAVAGPAAVAAPELAARFRLLGVMAPKGTENHSGQGVALIAVDGKPPRAYSLGSRIDGELVLQSVSLRSASIGAAQGPAAVTLEVPRLQAAATGTLPPVANSFGAAAPPLPPPVPPPGTRPVPGAPGVPARPLPAPPPLGLPPPVPQPGAQGPVSGPRDGGSNPTQ